MVDIERDEIQKNELSIVLDFLSNNNSDYCILHPFSKNGYFSISDLDLFISKNNFNSFKSFLFENGWKKEYNFRFSSYRSYFYKFSGGLKLKLDISHVYAVFDKNIFYQYNNNVRKIKGTDGYCYLSDFDGFILTVQKALVKNFISSNKFKNLLLLAKNSHELSAFESFSVFEDLIRQSSHYSKYFTSKKSDYFNLTNWFLAYARRLCFSSSNVTITFIGMDGSGKGTYISLFKRDLASRNYYYKYIYLGYSNFKLQLIKSINYYKEKHRNTWYYKFFFGLYLLLLPVEFLFRRGNGKYDVSISDRHPLFEPVSTKNLFKFYNVILKAVSPNPDLVIYLTGDVKQLWNRKREIEFHQYESKTKLLDSIVEMNRLKHNIVAIDTTNDTIENVYKKIFEAIRHYL